MSNEEKAHYKVRYSVTTTLFSNGEFSPDQSVSEMTINSDTNDLNEIFTDLFFKHRYDGIVGIEILSVQTMYQPELVLMASIG
jgi:hypothetical protein